MCTMPTITAVTSANEIINVVAKPANYINTVTTSLTFTYSVISNIPVNIFSIFKNLKSFGINFCTKFTLTTDAFINCNLLQGIQISNSVNLTYVPEGFAQKCLNVLNVMFDNNGIEVVDKNAFKGLSKLQTIYLNGNRISCLHPDTFQSSLVLQAIYLQYNKITAIDQNLFRNLPQLQAVDLSYNLIKYLPPFILIGTPVYQVTFAFYGNPITAIKPDICSTFANRPATLTDSINIKGVPCLPSSIPFNSIIKQNCQSSVNVLQGCYSNWTSAMSAFASCELPQICIPPALYGKFLEFMKTNP